jgi:hypothetical protein
MGPRTVYDAQSFGAPIAKESPVPSPSPAPASTLPGNVSRDPVTPVPIRGARDDCVTARAHGWAGVGSTGAYNDVATVQQQTAQEGLKQKLLSELKVELKAMLVDPLTQKGSLNNSGCAGDR